MNRIILNIDCNSFIKVLFSICYSTTKIGEWDKIGDGHKPHPNEYIIVNSHIEGKNYDIVQGVPVIQSGGVVTLLLDLGQNMRMSHDSQVKITTNLGNVFVSTIMIGQNKSWIFDFYWKASLLEI